MRGLFYPLVLLVLALLIGVGWLILDPESGRQATAAFSAITGRVIGKDQPPPRASDKTKPKPAKISRTPRAQPPAKAPEGSVTVTVWTFPPTEADRRFPAAPEITQGLAKSALLATFGPPEAMVTGADRGQLMERLLYRDPFSRRITLIFFADGNVTRAETYTQ
jgi:hypothetical protein